MKKPLRVAALLAGASLFTAGLGGTLPEAYPPPHATYLLERDGIAFTAPPCYGMHAPWWVVRMLVGEAEPEPMRDGDRWSPVTPNAKLSDGPVERTE